MHLISSRGVILFPLNDLVSSLDPDSHGHFFRTNLSKTILQNLEYQFGPTNSSVIFKFSFDWISDNYENS